jgi:site-specific DNA-methyltransferase (adenine-specific)
MFIGGMSMEIKMLKLAELIPYEKNPRKNDDAVKYVQASIKEFGFKVPIVIDKDNVIVCGHTRYKAAKSLKLNEVPCVVADDLTDEQIKAYRLADNKVSEQSVWDFDLLSGELDGIVDIDMTDFGFEGIEEEEPEVEEDDFEVELPEEPKAKLGDIYQLGNHRLMCGDSFSPTDIDKLMDGERAGLLLTDPPYGIDYGGMLKGKGDGKGGADKNGWKSYDAPSWDEKRPEKDVFDYMITLTDNQIIWGGNYFADVLPAKMCWLVWDKGQRDFSLADGELAWTSFDKALRIKTYSRASANREDKIHPTQKPIELLKWCIDVAEKNKANTERILDLFGGSGSTLITCEQLGKKCYTMELSEKYVDLIIERWEQYTGQKAVLLNGTSKNA